MGKLLSSRERINLPLFYFSLFSVIGVPMTFTDILACRKPLTVDSWPCVLLLLVLDTQTINSLQFV